MGGQEVLIITKPKALTEKDIKPGALIQLEDKELYKISTRGPSTFTAQLMTPAPSRTTVRTFENVDIEHFRRPSRAMMRAYDTEYDRR